MKILLLLAIISHSIYGVSTLEVLDTYQNLSQTIKKHFPNSVPGEILYLFDVDDTIIHTPDCLQDKKYPAHIKWKIKLLNCPYHITEPEITSFITSLQREGHHTMVLTARGEDFVTYTEKQLGELGLFFENNPFSSPFNFEAPLTKKKNFYFHNGLGFVSGTSKGNAIKKLQNEWLPEPAPYQQLVFIDDNKTNIKSVMSKYKNDPTTSVLVIHYTKYDD